MEHFHPVDSKDAIKEQFYGIYAAIYAFHPNQTWSEKGLSILQNLAECSENTIFLTEDHSKQSFFVWIDWLKQHTKPKAVEWFLITLSLIALEYFQMDEDVDKKAMYRSNFFWAVEALTNGKVYDPPSKFALLLAMGI